MTSGEILGMAALQTVLAGVAAAFVKWLGDISAQRIARHEQAGLDERIKQIEAQLDKESLEHEVRYKRIDRDVAEVLSDVYDKLHVLYEASYHFVRLGNIIQVIDASDARTSVQREQEAHAKVDEANRAFKDTFFRKRLYVPADLFRQVKTFHDQLIDTVSEMTHLFAEARELKKPVKSEAWKPQMNSINDEYSKLLDGITEAFQKRMGMSE